MDFQMREESRLTKRLQTDANLRFAPARAAEPQNRWASKGTQL